jgi:Domain of unknown function (DUF1842)
MAESDIEFPFNHTGEFTIGTGAPGAPTLRALLSVPRNGNTVTGHGVLTQAINPPLHSTTALHGLVTVEVFGGQSHQLYSLHGVPPRPGATYVSQLSIALDGIWGKTGKASYTYVHGGVDAPPHHIQNVPVKVRWLLQE